jgi:hypothetical protein
MRRGEQEVPTQWRMSGEGHGRFPARWVWSDPSPGNLHEPQTFPTSSLPQDQEQKAHLSHGFWQLARNLALSPHVSRSELYLPASRWLDRILQLQSDRTPAFNFLRKKVLTHWIQGAIKSVNNQIIVNAKILQGFRNNRTQGLKCCEESWFLVSSNQASGCLIQALKKFILGY